jgi:DNA-binding transcriptional MerR regulator
VKEISIGEFARRSRLSLKALRLYDERGVLVPARVDQASGYRYDDAAQLEEARLVVMPRQLAHREAFVALPGPGVASGVQIQLAAESLQAWAQEQEQGARGKQLTLTPEDLGERITYLATGPASADCDFAVPFGVER